MRSTSTGTFERGASVGSAQRDTPIAIKNRRSVSGPSLLEPGGNRRTRLSRGEVVRHVMGAGAVGDKDVLDAVSECWGQRLHQGDDVTRVGDVGPTADRSRPRRAPLTRHGIEF